MKALKDLVCSGEQEFCHILDVRRNFKGENFEEKLKQCLATCTSLLLIWSPSVRDYINENKPVSVPIGSTKETVCFSSAILTDFQNRTVKIVPESLLPEDNDQEDGYNNIVQLELQQGQKVSHRILQDKSIPKKVSDALNRIHCREAFTRSKSLVDS